MLLYIYGLNTKTKNNNFSNTSKQICYILKIHILFKYSQVLFKTDHILPLPDSLVGQNIISNTSRLQVQSPFRAHTRISPPTPKINFKKRIYTEEPQQEAQSIPLHRIRNNNKKNSSLPWSVRFSGLVHHPVEKGCVFNSPASAHTQVAGSFTSLGIRRRQPTDVSPSHQCFYPFLSL